MADQAQLELTISAKVDQALTGIQGLEAQLAKLSSAHQAGAQHAATHGASLVGLGHNAERAAQHVEFLALGFEHLRGIMFGGALTFGFEELIHHAAEFDLQADRLSRSLGGNAEAATAWIAIANHMGIEVPMLQRAFNGLNTGIESNHAIFREMGIATEDLNGKLRPTTAVLNDVADWFHKNAGAAGEAAAANALFGSRVGAQMLPILEQGSAGIANLTAEMKRLGLTMSSGELAQSVAFAHAMDMGKLAAEGLALRIGNALIPGLAVLAQAVVNNVGLMDAFAAAVNRAVSFVIGFLEGISGQTLAVDEASAQLGGLADAVHGAGEGLDSNTGKAHDNAAAQRALRDATRDQVATLDDQVRAMQNADKEYDRSTNAHIKGIEEAKKAQDSSLDRQIRAIQAADKEEQEAARHQEDAIRESSRVFQEQIDAQIQAIRDRAQAFDDSINDQIKSLEAANRTEQEQDKLAGLQGSKSAENKRLALDQANYEKELARGNFGALQALLDDMAQARAAGADADKKITQEERVIKIDSLREQLDKQHEVDKSQLTDLEKQRKAQVDAYNDQLKQITEVAAKHKQADSDLISNIQDEKRAYDDAAQSESQNLRDQMQQRRDGHAETVSLIEEQKRKIQEAANKELEAMQDAAAAGSEALRSGFSSPSIADAAGAGGLEAGLRFAKNFDAEGIGKKAGEALGTALKTGDWDLIGGRVGNALGSAIFTTLGKGFDNWTRNTYILGVSLADIGKGKDAFIDLWKLINGQTLPDRYPNAPGVTINPNISIPNDFPNGGAGGDPAPQTNFGGMRSAAGSMAALIPHVQETNRLLAAIANDTSPSGGAAASRRIA